MRVTAVGNDDDTIYTANILPAESNATTTTTEVDILTPLEHFLHRSTNGTVARRCCYGPPARP